jgi:glycosyltransferase involved in cell wall biosynthesis
MRKPGKVVIVSQHYRPDRSTTAAIMSAIAERLALQAPVLILSGTPGSASIDAAADDRLTVVEVKNRIPEKTALMKRGAAEAAFTLRAFWSLLKRLQPGDVALTVTAPFMLPYAVVAAARLKRARSALIVHDLYPEVLVVAGVLKPEAILAKAVHWMNERMFRALNAVIIIGRNTEPLLLRYRGMTRDKIAFIPNWATLAPAVRPVLPDNSYRRLYAARFLVGLSGNLGFTHDPVIVFEAAKLLRGESDIHFLLSGWGTGFERLKDMQSEAGLENVTLVERVEEESLEEFLSAANVWLIPYRKNVAGVSVPSRFYNLLAVGRPVILVSEPDAEAAVTVAENHVGWVVEPGNAAELADAIRLASRSDDSSRAERAVAVARRFSLDSAMTSYSVLIERLLQSVP